MNSKIQTLGLPAYYLNALPYIGDIACRNWCEKWKQVIRGQEGVRNFFRTSSKDGVICGETNEEDWEEHIKRVLHSLRLEGCYILFMTVSF